MRFDSLLDAYVRLVFEESDGEFSKDSVGRYICGKDVFGSDRFGRGLEKYVLGRIGGKFDVCAIDYFFILGDCLPADNIFLRLGGSPSEYDTPYRLAENDISIDVKAFNRRAVSVFDRLFMRKAAMPENVFAVRHNRLGAETLRAFMKAIFGAVNCQDIDGEIAGGYPRCVVSENDGIENSVKNKSRINSAPETASIVKQLKQFVGECVRPEWSV